MKRFLYFDMLKKIALNHGIYDEKNDCFIESGKMDLQFLNENHVFCTKITANPNYYDIDNNDQNVNALIEKLDDSFLKSRSEDRKRVSNILNNFDDDRDFLSIPFDVCSFESSKDGEPLSAGEFTTVYCIVLSESLKDMPIVVLLTIDENGEKKVVYSDNPEHFEIWKSVLFDTFIKINNNIVLRKKTVPEKMLKPVNNRKKKQTKNKKNKPRDYIYITGYKYNDEELFQSNKREGFSHCFEVRGHWRSINGIGLDRSGVRCINGATWVRPHRKGDENNIVGKNRVVI